MKKNANQIEASGISASDIRGAFRDLRGSVCVCACMSVCLCSCVRVCVISNLHSLNMHELSVIYQNTFYLTNPALQNFAMEGTSLKATPSYRIHTLFTSPVWPLAQY